MSDLLVVVLEWALAIFAGLVAVGFMFWGTMGDG